MSEPVGYIAAITERYEKLGYTPYRWYQAEDPAPWAPVTKPLGDAKLGVLVTCGAYALGQVAFHYKDDTSLRLIPKGTATEDLRFSHITENYLPDARRDPNCVVPIDALRALEADGSIGSVADEILSCMGGIYSQRRVREELIPAATEAFAQQEVDVALLVPM